MCFVTEGAWIVLKSQGQLRLKQIKELVKAMELFAGTARKGLQVPLIPSQCTHGQSLATFPLTQCMLSKYISDCTLLASWRALGGGFAPLR